MLPTNKQGKGPTYRKIWGRGGLLLLTHIPVIIHLIPSEELSKTQPKSLKFVEYTELNPKNPLCVTSSPTTSFCLINPKASCNDSHLKDVSMFSFLLPPSLPQPLEYPTKNGKLTSKIRDFSPRTIFLIFFFFHLKQCGEKEILLNEKISPGKWMADPKTKVKALHLLSGK